MAAVVRSASVISVGAIAAQLLRIAVKWLLARRGRKYGGLDGMRPRKNAEHHLLPTKTLNIGPFARRRGVIFITADSR